MKNWRARLFKWVWQEKGIESGEIRGREDGIDFGAEDTMLILTTDKSDEEIAKTTGDSVEKIQKLPEKLKTR